MSIVRNIIVVNYVLSLCLVSLFAICICDIIFILLLIGVRGVRTGYSIPVRDGRGAGGGRKFFRRRRRRRRRRPLVSGPGPWARAHGPGRMGPGPMGMIFT